MRTTKTITNAIGFMVRWYSRNCQKKQQTIHTHTTKVEKNWHSIVCYFRCWGCCHCCCCCWFALSSRFRVYVYVSLYVTLKFWIHVNPSNILTPLCKCVNCCIRQRLLSFCELTNFHRLRQTLFITLVSIFHSYFCSLNYFLRSM